MQNKITWKTPLAECEVLLDDEGQKYIGRVTVDGDDLFELTGNTLPQLRRDFELSCHLICANA